MLLHVGMDTVELQGRGLEVYVQPGAKVRAGEPLIRIDRGFMEKNHIDLTTMLVVTNGGGYQLEIAKPGVVKTGDPVIRVTR